MTTNEINATHNHLFRGEFATELVAAIRERLQRPRIITIGRSAAGQPFQVVAPPASDPAVAKWIGDGAPTCGSRWNGDYSDVVSAENRSGYIGD